MARISRRGWTDPPILVLMVLAASTPSAVFAGERAQPLANEAQVKTGKPARPEAWAVPMSRPGLGNFFRVTENLYRGEQPTAEGMAELRKLGIKTVVNLRLFHSDRDELGNLDLDYEHIGMEAWRPEDDEIIRFLKIVTDKDKTPVFVHCKHGSDRTGVMCAVYRIAVCGWEREEAIREMTEGGFGFHRVWQNLAEYVRKLDIEKLKRKAGLVK